MFFSFLSVSVHLPDKVVNVNFSVAPVALARICEASTLSDEPADRAAQLEGPQEVVYFLEMRATSVNLVHDILNSVNAELPQILINDVVRRNALPGPTASLADLRVAPLVD